MDNISHEIYIKEKWRNSLNHFVKNGYKAVVVIDLIPYPPLGIRDTGYFFLLLFIIKKKLASSNPKKIFDFLRPSTGLVQY